MQRTYKPGRDSPRTAPGPTFAKFINTRGNSTLGIGVCDRCKKKFPLHYLSSDPNVPGLKVCAADRDNFDPYRMPARSPDKVQLPFNRPDEPLTTPPQPDWLKDG